MKSKLFVCYSTNRDKATCDKFNKSIKNSIGLSKDEFDIFTVYNTGNISLTKAYNLMWNKVANHNNLNDSLIVFIHHDIHFKSNGWGKNLLNIFNTNDVNILGIAGTDTLNNHCAWWLDKNQQFDKNNLWGKVWHTDGKKEWKSDFTTVNKKCQKVQPVVAIDGVFMACDPETTLQFDEQFEGFHFYDISWCLKNITQDKKIVVTETLQITHDSGGAIGPEWEASRLKLCDLYKSQLPQIIK